MVINTHTLLPKASDVPATSHGPAWCVFYTRNCHGFKTILCKAYAALPRISIKTESSDYAMLQICMIHISAAFFWGGEK